MHDADDIVHTGYKGDGGIGIQFCDNVCRECADQDHASYVETYIWPHMSHVERKAAVMEHNRQTGDRLPISAARQIKSMPLYAEIVSEPEYY